MTMIPALAHGTRPGLMEPGGGLSGPWKPPSLEEIMPVSDVTRTVMPPLPASGWEAR